MGMLFALVGLLFGGAVPHKSQAIMSLCQAYDRWAVCAVAQPKPRFANRKWSGRSLLWLNPIFRVGRGVAIGRSTSPKRPPPVNDHLQSERGRLAGHVFACAFLCKPVQTERTPRRPGRPHSSTPPPPPSRCLPSSSAEPSSSPGPSGQCLSPRPGVLLSHSGGPPPGPSPPSPPRQPSLSPPHFKTKLCFGWQKGGCPRGDRCSFAHGEHELRPYHEAHGGMWGRVGLPSQLSGGLGCYKMDGLMNPTLDWHTLFHHRPFCQMI